jgi:hypothetical protein
MLASEIAIAITDAVHRERVGLGHLTAMVRRAARSESTAADLDGFCSAVAAHLAATRDRTVTAADVLAALQAS